MCNGRRYGSNNSLSGSISIGDCRRPFVHIFHCGLINPKWEIKSNFSKKKIQGHIRKKNCKNTNPRMQDLQKREKGRKKRTNKHLFNKIGLYNWQSKSIVWLNKQASIYHLQRAKKREKIRFPHQRWKEKEKRKIGSFIILMWFISFDAYNIEIRHTNVESFKSGHKMSMFLSDIYKLGKHILS